MGILENSLAGKLFKFHIANDNLFCLLILGPGESPLSPGEIRSVKMIGNLKCIFGKGTSLRQKMLGDPD